MAELISTSNFRLELEKSCVTLKCSCCKIVKIKVFSTRVQHETLVQNFFYDAIKQYYLKFDRRFWQ